MKRFLKKRFLGIPILAILLTVVVGAAVLAAAISNLWISPDITVEPVPPPANEPLVISSPDFTTPRSILVGQATLAGVNLTNPSPSGAPGYTGVLVEFSIYDKSDNTIVPSDIVLEYQEDDTWYVLTLTQDTGVLTGTFGPAGGFPVGYGYNVTTPLRATFATPGIYYATAQATQ